MDADRLKRLLTHLADAIVFTVRGELKDTKIAVRDALEMLEERCATCGQCYRDEGS